MAWLAWCNPWVNTIDNNLFSAFASLIDMMLDDDKAFFISKGHFFEPDYPRLGRSELTAENDLLRGSGPKGIPIVRSVTVRRALRAITLTLRTANSVSIPTANGSGFFCLFSLGLLATIPVKSSVGRNSMFGLVMIRKPSGPVVKFAGRCCRCVRN